MAASSEASLSREAEAVRAMYAATSELRSAVGGCSSARELHASGFGDDVDIALEVDSSEVVPVMTDGAFRASTK